MKFSTEAIDKLAAYQAWIGGPGSKSEAGSPCASLQDYAASVATPDLLFAFAALFFCEVIEVDKHLFLKHRFDQRAYEAWKKQLTDARDIQRVMNRTRIATLLQNARVDDAGARACAELLAAAWNEVHIRRGANAEVHGTTVEDLSVTLVNLHE